jgi:hypothetical protein
MKFVFWLALILAFSPGEKEQPLLVSAFAKTRPASPVARISVRPKTILLLLGEKAGMRESVNLTSSSANPSGLGYGMEMVVTLALNLTFSLGEKEQPLLVSGFANTCPANPAAQISARRKTILPLPSDGRGPG